jgi:hypothetical protein
MQTEPPKADPPRRKRRWFQFSLRSLLIVVTLLAVNAALWRAFGPPVRVIWVQTTDGHEGWALGGGNKEIVLAMIVQACVFVALILPRPACSRS